MELNYSQKRTIAWLRGMARRLAKAGGLLSLAAFIFSTVSVPVLRVFDPPTSSFILQTKLIAWWDGNREAEVLHEWVDWDRIAPTLKVAAVTSEDQRFAEHNGFDLTAIREAIDEYEQGKKLRGASTITQQVAKNLYLWGGPSFLRKAIEAYFTVLIEWFWPKKRILEVYLNIAQFGKSVYGVEAAAQTYFNKSAARLNTLECALMVTALPSPSRYNLADPSPYMIRRRNWILQYMVYLDNLQYLDRLE